MFRRLLVLVLAAVSLSAQTYARQDPPSDQNPAPSTESSQDQSAPVTEPPHDQSAPASSRITEAQTKIRINSNLVVLPVTVKNEVGDLVPGLQQNDFRVFDNNIEQSIDVFTAEAFPLSLVVLIDDDLKAKEAAQMSASLRAIIGGISAYDEALICRFDLTFYPGDGFTGDLDKLWAALKDAQDHSGPSNSAAPPFVVPPSTHAPGVGEPVSKVPINPGHRPTKALDDAVHYAAELLHDRGVARRKMILVISDGANAPQLNQHTYKDSLELLLHDNISVYSLAVGSTLSKQKYARLLNYADDTGGDIYYADKSYSMERLYAQITEEARHEYTLAYVPHVSNARSLYHAIEVRTTRSGFTVKTRQGYFAGPLPTSTESPAATDQR